MRPPVEDVEDVEDVDESWPLAASGTAYRGSLISVDRDEVRGLDGGTFVRDVVRHPGSVAVLAIDEDDRVLVVVQYRHPVRRRMVELPAGLLDKAGELPLAAAQRELAEEARYAADEWQQLLKLAPSPGISDEQITIFVARGVRPADVPEGFTAEHEEASMTTDWVPLADLVAGCLAGRLGNGPLVAGVLAVWAGRD